MRGAHHQFPLRSYTFISFHSGHWLMLAMTPHTTISGVLVLWTTAVLVFTVCHRRRSLAQNAPCLRAKPTTIFLYNLTASHISPTPFCLFSPLQVHWMDQMVMSSWSLPLLRSHPASMQVMQAAGLHIGRLDDCDLILFSHSMPQ